MTRPLPGYTSSVMALLYIAIASLCLVRPSDAVPHARHPSVALEVGPSGELRNAHVPDETAGGAQSKAKPLMRVESQAVAASRTLDAEAQNVTALEHSAALQVSEARQGGDASSSVTSSAGVGAAAAADEEPVPDELGRNIGVSDEQPAEALTQQQTPDEHSEVLPGVDAAALLADSDHMIPGMSIGEMVGDVAYRAADILMGTTGIGDGLDYPFACICGPDGNCIGDSMGTKCSGRAGAGSGKEGG